MALTDTHVQPVLTGPLMSDAVGFLVVYGTERWVSRLDHAIYQRGEVAVAEQTMRT